MRAEARCRSSRAQPGLVSVRMSKHPWCLMTGCLSLDISWDAEVRLRRHLQKFVYLPVTDPNRRLFGEGTR